MIIRFTVDNIYSFGESTEFSLIAGKGTTNDGHVLRGVKRDDISILRSSIVYGANASGKSNLVKSLNLLKKIAINGIPATGIPFYKLCTELKEKATLEVELKYDKTYYAYGVVVSSKEILEEWLYVINKRSENKIFERKNSSNGVRVDIGKGLISDKSLSQMLNYMGETTPKNKSYLSEYMTRNGKNLNGVEEVFDWFSNRLKIIFPNTKYKGLSFNLHMKEEFVKPLETMLKFFQTGIDKIRKDKIKVEQLTDVDNSIIAKIQRDLKPKKAILLTSRDGKANYTFQLDLNGNLQVFKLRTEHKRMNNGPITFEMSEESDGSLRMIDFIPALIDMTHNPSVYLVDEIDRSLHPMLTYELFEYYFNKICNNRDTQLICTTHESNLLDLNLFRSDEVWFVEKDKKGSSHITSLVEYKPRPDVNLKTGYLQGRYGAIPFFGNLNDLHW